MPKRLSNLSSNWNPNRTPPSKISIWISNHFSQYREFQSETHPGCQSKLLKSFLTELFFRIINLFSSHVKGKKKKNSMSATSEPPCPPLLLPFNFSFLFLHLFLFFFFPSLSSPFSLISFPPLFGFSQSMKRDECCLVFSFFLYNPYD